LIEVQETAISSPVAKILSPRNLRSFIFATKRVALLYINQQIISDLNKAFGMQLQTHDIFAPFFAYFSCAPLASGIFRNVTDFNNLMQKQTDATHSVLHIENWGSRGSQFFAIFGRNACH
jgi:hypothetical protein